MGREARSTDKVTSTIHVKETQEVQKGMAEATECLERRIKEF
jgi:hypothetical protein